MEPLVRWLLGGFILSLLFIIVARWFWKRYDKPSEAALEWQKEQEEKRKERKVWESVEMQMRREAEEAERKAAFQIKREVAASSGKAPDAKTVSKAFESLGTPVQQSASTEKDLETESDDSDVDYVPELVQVRQDAWDGSDEQPDEQPQEPDWELVERLKRIAGSDETEEVPHPEIPEAPSLPNLEEPTSEQFHSWLTEEE
tara:strand:- start:131 stop:733 length:603 start_codon:yes stop_codon:yes gene_type:complete